MINIISPYSSHNNHMRLIELKVETLIWNI
jgi:hypothetical protein